MGKSSKPMLLQSNKCSSWNITININSIDTSITAMYSWMEMGKIGLLFKLSQWGL